ncbi:Crp/Fnr family transcriptional regulator [Chishuiella sp.]|uniref:Crp/Fnr family transcriptional regulator n=1 Tax=Chishuiella sp. TaxID=1969467 RepID=UPI0028A7A018|nr:Crp/Fnr family transcriptional regulator [Chishuiella sp.]
MMEIEQILNKISLLSKDSIQLIKSKINLITLPKGSILFDTKRVETKVYFIKRGIARAYTLDKENEITFWFGQEGDFIISIRSYVENKPSYEIVELLEDCELYEINTNDLYNLYNFNLEFSNWGRKFTEKDLMRTEEIFIFHKSKSATERYQKLLKDNPSLINRVQLGHIASYLGISQVTLSRIRAEI